MPEWARASWLLGSADGDLVLAVGLYAAVVLEVLDMGLGPMTVVSAAVRTLPLAARRRAPLFAARGVLTSVLLQRGLGGSVESLDTGIFCWRRCGEEPIALAHTRGVSAAQHRYCMAGQGGVSMRPVR
jgi:hypothetical protein